MSAALMTERIYPTLTAFLDDRNAPERPAIPPGGCCGPKENDHMTFLAYTIRKTADRAERLRKLQNYAVLLERFAPGEPCLARVMQWHEEVLGAER